jgi:hypothetical protein
LRNVGNPDPKGSTISRTFLSYCFQPSAVIIPPLEYYIGTKRKKIRPYWN